MIAEAVLNFVFALIGAVIALFPSGGAPAWITTASGYLSDVVGYASGLGAWFPFTLGGTVLTAAVACMVTGFVIRLVRMVVSIFTGGGGSAA